MPNGGTIQCCDPRRQQVGDQAEHGLRGGGFGQRHLVDLAEHPTQSGLRDQHRPGLHLHRENGRGIGMDLDGVGRPAGVGPPGSARAADPVRISDRASSSRSTRPVAVRVRPNRSVKSLRSDGPMRMCEGQRPGQRGAGPVREVIGTAVTGLP